MTSFFALSNLLYSIALCIVSCQCSLGSGYRNSRPVRVGNASYKQFQLDIYGVAMDTLYLASKYAQPISWGGWQHIRRIVDWVCDHWMDPDHSIWGQHY